MAFQAFADGSLARIRAVIRRYVPAPWRRTGRYLLQEVPYRVRDFAGDLADRARDSPLPPPRLRFRVCGTSSRVKFLETGSGAAADVLKLFEANRRPSVRYGRWLDFGCGCGRVARHLLKSPDVEELWGVDVDGEAVAWSSRNLPGNYLRIAPDPPTGLPSNNFEAIYAGSVFTHLNEQPQMRWLAELHRVMRSGALLIASTHGPGLLWTRSDLSAEGRESFARGGFLFAPGPGPFNDDTAFHAREYLRKAWGQFFECRDFRTHGLTGYQDLSVWQKA
jgi:SAM-dependent methyltransferase